MESGHLGETAVRLFGTEEARQCAKTLIEKLLSKRAFDDFLVLEGEEAERYMENKREAERTQMAQIDWKKADEEYVCFTQKMIINHSTHMIH